MVTPRERWLAVLSGKRADRVPCDFWATAEVKSRLRADLGCKSDRELWERIGIDKCIHFAPLHPLAKEDDWHIDSNFAIWHVGTKEMSYQGGLGVYVETVEHPLAKAETVADIQ